MKLTSPAFDKGGRIPKRHTGEGPDISPALEWSDPPKGTLEFALICDDPDAPTAEPWVHWVVWGIPGTERGLPESEPGDVGDGMTDFGRTGYGGPMPPKGHGTHHYHFTLYALGAAISLPRKATKADLLRAIDGAVIAEAELIGTYER